MRPSEFALSRRARALAAMAALALAAPAPGGLWGFVTDVPDVARAAIG